MQKQYFTCVKKSYKILSKAQLLTHCYVFVISYILFTTMLHVRVIIFNWQLKNATIERKKL